MRRIAATVLTVTLAVASPAQSDDGNRLKLARQLVDVTHLAEKIRRILPTLTPSIEQALSREMVDAATREKATLLIQASPSEDFDRLMDQVAALYARELTDEDLSNILAFYQTPSGRDMLAKEAEIGGAIGTLAFHWAVTLADRAVADRAGAESATTTVSAADRWRAEYIAAPSRAAALQQYFDPMEKPEWTALRTITLAKLIAERCRGVRLNEGVLGNLWHRSGLDAASVDDLGLMSAIVAPTFSYFDANQLKLVCAASDDLFGNKGRLVPDLLSSGDGLPMGFENGYVRVPTITGLPHGKG